MFAIKQKRLSTSVLLLTAPLLALLAVLVLPAAPASADDTPNSHFFRLACEKSADFKATKSRETALLTIRCENDAVIAHTSRPNFSPAYIVEIVCKLGAPVKVMTGGLASDEKRFVVKCSQGGNQASPAVSNNTNISYSFTTTHAVGCLVDGEVTGPRVNKTVNPTRLIAACVRGTVSNKIKMDFSCSSGWAYEDLKYKKSTALNDRAFFCARTTSEADLSAGKINRNGTAAMSWKVLGPGPLGSASGTSCSTPPCNNTTTQTPPSDPTYTPPGSRSTTDTTDLNYKPECDFNNNGITPDPLDTPADQIELGPDGKTEYECHFQLASRTAEPIPADKDGLCPEDYIKVSIGLGTVSEKDVDKDLNNDRDKDDVLPLQCVPRGGTLENNPIMFLLRAGVRFLAAGMGIVITGSLIVTGIRYMTSRGEPQVIHDAKIKMLNITIGFVMYILTVAILNFLIPGGLL